MLPREAAVAAPAASNPPTISAPVIPAAAFVKGTLHDDDINNINNDVVLAYDPVDEKNGWPIPTLKADDRSNTQSTSDGAATWQMDLDSEVPDRSLVASALNASLARGPSIVEMRHTKFEDNSPTKQGKNPFFQSTASTMDTSSSSLRHRTHLPFYRERRLKQHDSEGHLAKKWRAQREEAWAELEVKVGPFLKTFFYELMPSYIAVWVVMAIDGKSHARDRAFWPIRFGKVVLWESTFVCAVFGLIYWRPQGLSRLDAVTLLLLWTAKAMTIAFKYSFYGYRDLYGEYGIGSQAYESQRKRDRFLLSNIVFNMGGLQGIGLFEQLYASALIQDVDLSHLKFDVTPATAHQVWAEVKSFIRTICPSKCKESENDPQGSCTSLASSTPAIPEHTDKFESHPPTDSNQPSLASSPGVSLGRSFSRLVDPQTVATKRRHFGSKYELEAAQMDVAEGLVDIFLGEDEESVLKNADMGRVSAAMVALHCIVTSHMLHGRIRVVMFFTPLGCSFLLGLLPLLINHLTGEPTCFATPEGTVVFVCQTFALSMFFFNIFYFTFAPLKFFWNQRRVDAYLFGMLAGDFAVRAIWPPVCVMFSPRIDCEVPANVAAWSAVQRVIRGSHFAPTFQKRFNFYRVVTFGVLVMDSLLHSFLSAAFPHLDATGSRVTSTVRLLTLTSAVVFELMLGMLVNNFADRHAAYLGKLRTSNAAMATQGVEEGHREDLLASEHLLDTCMQEIEKDKLASPVTVAFFAAEIARVSLLLSVVGVIIYQDLHSMMQNFGFES